MGGGGVIPTHRARFSGRDPDPAERAPEALQGLEWVGSGCRARRVLVPPSGPGRCCPSPSLYQDPAYCALLAKGARFDLILCKVSQNDEVSTKYVNKASHSPYFQNAVQKSPLEFLRFLILLAFSHKELMGCFDP